ncbi:MAG TPA: redoxin domain-containing protein [Fimbriimonadaceae bacterium]|nr:redoxin domain-containing protein [Fimbriimonadaceae bacterium]
MLQKTLILGVIAVFGLGAQTQDLRPGEKAPAFLATTIDGNRVAFQDLNKGGPVFLYFIREGDRVNTAASTYVDRILKAYMPARAKWFGVTDGDEAHARSWLARYNNPYQMLMDRDRRLVHAFQIASSPTVIEIRSDGTIGGEWIGYSGPELKSLNMATARANRIRAKAINLSGAPSTTEYGEAYAKG